MFFESNELVETQRRHLTRHIVGQSRSPVTISVIIIAFAAARETTAVIVADASRVVLTRGTYYIISNSINIIRIYAGRNNSINIIRMTR